MEHYQIKLIETAVLFFGYLVSIKVSERLIERAGLQFGYPKDRMKIIRKILNIIFSVVLVSVALFIWGVDQSELMYFITSLLTVMGIAFIAQWSILSNVTASFIIFFNHPVKLGDTVMVMDKDFNVQGRVSDIGIFFLILKTVDGEQIAIPTNVFLQKMVKKTS